ncbi:MAG: 30S ribosomal protein S13 [Patescibacteria group bacterium]|mgnify:CR=1 FL=1|jgi:small subunit ribosomal protein S13
MVRIAGVNLPDNKKVEFSLAYIYGVGRPLARKIAREEHISLDKRMSELKPEEINRVQKYLERHIPVEGALRRGIAMNIKRLKEIGSWRGLRHMRGLPVRGQRTKTNSRTRRGNVRKTMMSGKRALEKK